jgi:mannose-1-phosphate guanylyltransferase/phosphomannomutase
MKAVVLAAGRGVRLGRYTNAVNKEMILIGEYPVIEYIIRALATAGVDKIFIVLTKGKDQIINYLKDGKDFGVNVTYVYQDVDRGYGTAKAVEAVEPWLDENFILVNADTFFSPSEFFSEIIDYHKKMGSDATMSLYPMKNYKRFGVVKLDEDKNVRDIVEKPLEERIDELKVNDSFLVNTGLMVLSPSIFGYIKKTRQSRDGEYWITDSLKLMIEDGKKVCGFIIPENVFWKDIGTQEARLEAEKFVFEKNIGFE